MYFINDYIHIGAVHEVFNGFRYRLNGNGNSIYPDTSFRKVRNLYSWNYPCDAAKGQFNLIAHVAVMDSLNHPYTENFHHASIADHRGTLHGGEDKICGQSIHTQLQIFQPLNHSIIQTFLYPQKCGTSIPTVTKSEKADQVTTTITFLNKKPISSTVKLHKNAPVSPTDCVIDTVANFHLARLDGGVFDTILNPFNLPKQGSSKLIIDAKKVHIRNHTLGYSGRGYKYCEPTYVNIKYVNFTNGTFVKFNDTVLVTSSIFVDATFEWNGRFNYLTRVIPLTTPTPSDSIVFYLPDLDRGVDMIALTYGSRDTIYARYDSILKQIHLPISADGMTFTIEEKQKCQDCFFPPISMNIDTVFDADDGKEHVLGHKLTVKRNQGLLNITEGTKISMCTGVYLLNKDTIIIEGPCQSEAVNLKTCSGILNVPSYDKNSAIIISPQSALVLDSGSRTYIRKGGAIYVKSGGSLVIKNDAFVQIGDSCNCGWAEIIAEQGAYIHIESKAQIEFRRKIGDTADRNIFKINFHVPYSNALAGVNSVIDTILKTDSILPFGTVQSIPICDLDSINPIKNKEWGYANFAKPHATFKMRKDTLCPGEPFFIQFNRVLNDASYQLKVCQLDSVHVLSGGIWYWKYDCTQDTLLQDSLPPDPTCIEPKKTPKDFTYYFRPGTLHLVSLIVWNDCGKSHDTSVVIYVADTPRFNINAPLTACSGYNNIHAAISRSNNDPVFYTFEVMELFDSTKIQSLISNPIRSYSKSFYGVLPDSFNFPDFNFRGDAKYLLTLCVTNSCRSFCIDDTINIPLGAYIQLERPTVYADPVFGATSVRLHGYTSLADSFRWVSSNDPTNWLNRTDSLVVISSPQANITYVLIAHTGSCVASDTAFIKYNHVANAGISDTVCFNTDEVLLGNPYDFSLFLGWLHFVAGDNRFHALFIDSTTNNPAYFRYLTHFMMTDAFKTWAVGCDNQYDKFVNQLYRQQIFEKSWFKTYYKNLITFTDPDMPALNDFRDHINGDATLFANMNGLTDWGVIEPCLINDFFNLYDDYKANHFVDVSAAWSQVVDGDTTSLLGWDNYFVAIDTPAQTTVYIQNVISTGYAEIDEVTIFVDTTLTVAFAPSMQFDSTVYFQNYTDPSSSATKYEWDFGDGSARSNEENPVHTFPSFDTSFIVCLKATNHCNSWTTCDTVYIDSTHWGGTFYTRRAGTANDLTHQNTGDQYEGLKKEISQTNTSITNYPNPFDGSTTIAYEIWQSFQQAEIRIVNMLGQPVFSQKLTRPMDQVLIDGSVLANGMYYYSLVVDGATKQTKSMSVMH